MILKKLTPIQRNALAMILISALTTPLMLSAVNVALPSIAQELEVNAVLLSWVPLAYLMASAMFVLIFGRLADMFGRKRIFLIGTSSAVITSIAAACSTSGEMLVAFRFLQGVSAAMLYATQVAIISSVFPPKMRGAAIGIMVAVLYSGLMLGPVIGGYLIDFFDWRSCFLFQIPLALLVITIGLFKVDEDWQDEKQSSFDKTGAIIYALSIFALSGGVSLLPSLEGGIVILLGILGVWLFVKVEKDTKQPLFDVSLFLQNKIFTLSCLASLLMYTATFANVVLVSFYLQYLKDYSASTTGLIMMVQPLVMAIFSPLAGRLSDRIEPRLLSSAGIGITALGLIILSLLNEHSADLLLIIALLLTGLGFGLFSSPNTNAIMSSVKKPQYGIAAGSVATMRVVGQLTSMVMVTMVMTLLIGPVQISAENYHQLQQVIQLCFSIAALLCIPAMFFSLSRGHMHSSEG